MVRMLSSSFRALPFGIAALAAIWVTFLGTAPQAKAAPDLRITKTAVDPVCEFGNLCRVNVVIRNHGRSFYRGPIAFTDATTPGLGPLTAYRPAPPWTCSRAGAKYRCVNANVSLPPRGRVTVTLEYRVRNKKARQARSCSAIVADYSQGTDYSVAAGQRALTAQGFRPGTADGQAGPSTRRAVRAFQRQHGLTVTGRFDDATFAALLGSRQPVGGKIVRGRGCVTIQVENPEDGFNFPTPGKCSIPGLYYNESTDACERIECAGGTVRNGACVCPDGEQNLGGVCGNLPGSLSDDCTGGRERQFGLCRCPAGTLWNRTTAVCDNVRHDCPQGQTWDVDQLRCISICPRGLPWNGETCVCPGDKFWDRKTGRCLDEEPVAEVPACPLPGQTRNRASGRCEFKDPVRCRGGTVRDGRCVCPEGKQNWGGVCGPRLSPGSCTGGRERKNFSCQCPDGTAWNPVAEQCQNVPRACPFGQTYDADRRRCARICARGKHWNGRRCVVCKPGQRWNQRTRRCAKPKEATPSQCRDIQRRRTDGGCCAQGTVARGNRCVKTRPTGLTCPAGAKKSGNRCICRRPARWSAARNICQCPRGSSFYRGRCVTN